MENQNLRNAIEDLTLTFQEFQLKMTKELHEKSQSLSELEMRANSSSAALSCLEQAKYIENRLDATTALLTSATNPSSEIQTEANESNPSNLGKFTSPSRIYKPSLIGTPTARPLNWIVKQANTEVKLLRKKAENLQWYIPPAKEVDDETYDENSSDENKENNCANESVTSSSSQFDDLTKRYQTKLHKLKKQLEDAVNVICEQDRLIHAGR